MYPISFEVFKDYLESLSPTEVVGYQGSSQGCPIYNFIRKDNRLIKSVGSRTIIFYTNSKRMYKTIQESSDWVRIFIELIDNTGTYLSRQVIAEEALALLTSGQLDDVLLQEKSSAYLQALEIVAEKELAHV